MTRGLASKGISHFFLHQISLFQQLQNHNKKQITLSIHYSRRGIRYEPESVLSLFMNSLSSTFIKITTTKNTTITITIISSSGEASGIDPQAFYRGCGEPGVPAGQGLTCTVEQLFDVKVFFSVLSFLCGFVFVIAGGWLALSNNSLM